MTTDYTVTIDKILNCLKKTQLLLCNTELNDLRVIICLRKSEVSVERISARNAMKNWRSMAYTVCFAVEQITSYICY